MLRKLLLVMFVIGTLSACAPAPVATPTPTPQDTAADEAKLKADLQKWMDGMNAGTAEGVASQYAEDAVLMPPNAPAVTGRTAIGEFLGKESAGMKAGSVTMKVTAVTGVAVSGDMAWMSGTYAVNDAKGTTLDVGKFLSAHKNTNGAWLYVRDTWNSDAPPPPAPAKK